MKKIIIVVIFLAVVFSSATRLTYSQDTTNLLSSQNFNERIESFESQIIIKTDGIIEVIETIKYNFGSLEKHGIYRNIPATN